MATEQFNCLFQTEVELFCFIPQIEKQDHRGGGASRAIALPFFAWVDS